MLKNTWALGLAVIAVASLGVAEPAFAKPKRQRLNGSSPNTPATSPNLRPVGSGDLKYEWVRGGLKIELRNRDGRWTQAEALAIAVGLDRLPDPYVKKAIDGGLEKIYRDGSVPRAPQSFLASLDDDEIAGFAVPAWPWHYVSLGDNAFTFGADETYYVITHELGHCVQHELSGLVGGTRGFTGISWTTALHGLKSWNGFATDYARVDHREDFAESATFFWLAPDVLRGVSPAKHAFMRSTAFGGLDSPPSARLSLQATAPIVPAIRELGDRSHNPGSLVTVKGDFFMAPFDGGYNTVRYRGQRAANVPISRRTTYSWVPRISTGSAPVTMTTQDGTSAPVAFTVDKPWWKFW